MKIVQGGGVPIEEKKSEGRVGTYKRRVLLRGEGNRGNFSLIVYYQDGSFRSPRHHHNFDQFRYQIEGKADFGRNGRLTAGVLGYFPEGAYYGPQSGPPHTVAVLQFGGPSGSGYLDPQQHMEAREILSATGVFAGGVYRRNPDVEGKKNQDAYEAIWECANQRRLVYPKPQYTGPIMIDSNQCPWQPLEGSPGVAEKALGSFTNCKIRAARYKLDPGAAYRATGRGIYMVLSGTGTIESQPAQALTSLYLDDGEHATFSAVGTTEILLMGMPSIALMAEQPPASPQTLAAE